MMLRSQIKDEINSDFSYIYNYNHIHQVDEEIKLNFNKYFELMINKSSGNLSRAFNVALSNEVINKFNKEKIKYKVFFDLDCLHDYRDDVRAFKAALTKECPVICKAMNSKRSEMREWKIKFINAKPKELLETFENILIFANDYAEKYNSNDYQFFSHWEDFNLEDLETEKFQVLGVVGMGIVSTVLYYLYPHIFPSRNRQGLYGLYFLTGHKHFDLPSKNSEFLMINDTHKPSERNYKMDQNYWYPYSLYALYAIRLYRLIQERSKCIMADLTLSENYRYVYVNAYLERVCNQNNEVIKTMLGGEQD